MSDIAIGDSAPKRRHASAISLLLPARSYRILCAWTKQKALPAIEGFSCRLLILFGELNPADIKNFFGLSSREVEVLINTLLENKLIKINVNGALVPTPLLAKQSTDNSSQLVLTEYEEKSETAIFELLTKSLIPKPVFDSSRFGLPELEVKSNEVFGKEEVVIEFSRKYREYLEYSHPNVNEAQNTRLYKITSCETDRVVQVPIDIDIHIQLGTEGELKVYREAVETVGKIRKRSLSNELEACVADYLAGLVVPDPEMSIVKYCGLVGDDVLLNFIKNDKFDFSSWLHARENRKTGYGKPDTTAMLGPLYLLSNRTKIIETIRESRRVGWGENEKRQALWLSSNVPLWGASGFALAEFSRKVENELAENTKDKGDLSVIFEVHDTVRERDLKNVFSNRIENGIGLHGQRVVGRMELFVVPGILAVAQYQVQLSPESGLCIPIGYITTEPSKLEIITNLLFQKFDMAAKFSVMWSKGKKDMKQLLGDKLFELTERQFEGDKKRPEERVKTGRAILSLNSLNRDKNK